MDMAATGTALCVQGNHESRLLRKFNGRNVKLSHGLVETLAQIDALPERERGLFIAETRSFIEGVNRTICIDTGCVFGGKLTALRYPEIELVDVPATRICCEPVRPLTPTVVNRTAQQSADTMLDIDDVTGKRAILTSLMGHVRIEAENAAAALEVISQFSVDPLADLFAGDNVAIGGLEAGRLFEHPEDAFAYYERAKVGTVMTEAKHMGSRAVLVLARDEGAARRHSGTEDRRIGRIYEN